jgi:hypothetical protein
VPALPAAVDLSRYRRRHIVAIDRDLTANSADALSIATVFRAILAAAAYVATAIDLATIFRSHDDPQAEHGIQAF